MDVIMVCAAIVGGVGSVVIMLATVIVPVIVDFFRELG